MARYWFSAERPDLGPIRGYESRYCGGRHGGEFHKTKANFEFRRGPRSEGRYPDAAAYCRYCGNKTPGVAAGLFRAELDEATGRTRSASHRLGHNPDRDTRAHPDDDPRFGHHVGLTTRKSKRQREAAGKAKAQRWVTIRGRRVRVDDNRDAGGTRTTTLAYEGRHRS